MNAALYTSLLVLLGLVAVASSQITQSPAQPLGTPIPHGKPPVPSRGAACQDDIPTGTYPYCDNCTGTTTTTAGYNVQTPVSCRCSSSCVQAASLGLFSEEKTWLATRTAAATQAMSTYFTSAWGKDNIQYNLSELLEVVPRIGLAFSGGGYRAMLGGAGVMQAFDDTKNGGVAGVAGILSSSLYISGLSGGGWLVGSWALNSFAPVQDLNNFWNLSTDSFWGTLIHQWFIGDTACYGIQCEVQTKNWSGAPISLADDWGRLIARNILTNLYGDTLYSNISKEPLLSAKPLPILTFTGRTTKDLYEYSGTVFEITPFSFGSWDRHAIGGFIEARQMGSYFWQGRTLKDQCMAKLDNAAFILGASSLAMSGALVQDVNYTIREASANVPNPFCGFGTGVQTDCTKYQPLLLNDGGDNGQNIPLLPHLQPDRKMDVVIAIDQSDDASDGYGTCCGYNWPQAYSLNWTRWYAEQPRGRGQGIAVPKSLPTPQQVSDKLSLVYTPTFFGCDPRDSTNPSAVPPLIVYLPNAPYAAYSNGTTSSTPGWEWGRLSAQHITNGLALASTGIPPGQAPDDTPAWPVCLACALADRARLRMKSKPGRSDQCIACFTAYCDDTKLDVPGLKDPISGYYSPPPIPNRFGTASPTDASYCYVYPEGYTTDCGNKTKCACNIPNACSDYNEYCSSSDVDEEADEVEADRLKTGFGKDEL